MGVFSGTAMQPFEQLALMPAFVKLIGEIDEFKGRWQALGKLAPERLSALRRIATIESIGSSTRIEGAKLTDEEVDRLLSGIDMRSLRAVTGIARAPAGSDHSSRDEEREGVIHSSTRG
jgi:hypothetical protein